MLSLQPCLNLFASISRLGSGREGRNSKDK
jgi:hypothetical protein